MTSYSQSFLHVRHDVSVIMCQSGFQTRCDGFSTEPLQKLLSQAQCCQALAGNLLSEHLIIFLEFLLTSTQRSINTSSDKTLKRIKRNSASASVAGLYKACLLVSFSLNETIGWRVYVLPCLPARTLPVHSVCMNRVFHKARQTYC